MLTNLHELIKEAIDKENEISLTIPIILKTTSTQYQLSILWKRMIIFHSVVNMILILRQYW